MIKAVMGTRLCLKSCWLSSLRVSSLSATWMVIQPGAWAGPVTKRPKVATRTVVSKKLMVVNCGSGGQATVQVNKIHGAQNPYASRHEQYVAPWCRRLNGLFGRCWHFGPKGVDAVRAGGFKLAEIKGLDHIVIGP